MGFLKKVFGTGDTTIALSVERDRVVTGGDVVLRWEIDGELDEKARGLRAGVTATGYWLERERDHDGVHDHDDHRPGEHRRVEQREETVWEDAVELPAQLGAGTATITIPDTAQPGSKGVLKWTAWVLVDREKGRDAREEVTLYVRRPELEAEPREFAADGLVVTGVPDQVRLGRRYPGTVTLTVPEAMKGTLRLFLVRRVRHVSAEHHGSLLGALPEALSMPKLPGQDLLGGIGVHADHVIERSEEEVELDLSGGKQELEPGRPHEFSFELEVPGRGPTTLHDHAQVDWRVVVKLDRTLRGDLRAAKPLDVS